MRNRFTMAQTTVAIRRWGAFPVLALATTFAALTAAPPADAASSQGRPSSAPTEATAPRTPGEPIMAVVSIKSQHVTLYDADGWILRAPVSSGTTGRETPAGVFSVVEKDKDHHSNLYDDASMPNMQRLTWSGIALHGGPLPGHAASHGCVRLPYDFAENIFDKTPMGMRVIISPNDAEPVAFTAPALFVPNAEAIAAAPAHADALADEAAKATKEAEEAKRAAAAATHAASSVAATLRKMELLKTRGDAERAYAEKVVTAAEANLAKAEDAKQKAAAKVADVSAQVDAAKADGTAKADSASPDDAPPAPSRRAALLATPARKLQMLKIRADGELAMADRALEAAKVTLARAEDVKQKATAKATELSAQLDAAKADPKSKLDAATAAQNAAKAADAKKVAAIAAARDAKLALEPVSLFVSRSTQRLYVRHGAETGYEVPVTIRDPDKPLGTHVFTAVAPASGGFRWTAVTIDSSDDAKDAFDRITFPKDVLDRIGATALPRSSIIISDEPANREQNYRTEFVVVLTNQPQGGLAMRKRSDPVRVARGGIGDFFGFQWGNGDNGYARQRGGQTYYQQRQWQW
jgi:L,D-transpeptidase catalytic domain